MANEKILIVEDDEDIIEMIEYNLKKEGFSAYSVSDGAKVLGIVESKKPDLIILDLMLPGMDGLDVCKSIRNKQFIAHIPIIMLTAKSQEADKVIGLEIGADDYMIKPFSPRELIARIKALLRRLKKSESSAVLISGIVEIDTLKHRVRIKGKEIDLTATEFKLFEFMLRNHGMALSRAKILDSVFGYDSVIYDRTVDAHMKSLRKKLGKASDCIETIRGVGYRFKES
ncbi:MAG: response regulator transcription factor [Candidatus Omnitrophota bacterium]